MSSPDKTGRAHAREEFEFPPESFSGTAETQASKATALTVYSETGSVRAAMIAAGRRRGTWYDWLESDPAFREAYERETPRMLVERLMEAATASDKSFSATCLKFALERRGPVGFRSNDAVMQTDWRDDLRRQGYSDEQIEEFFRRACDAVATAEPENEPGDGPLPG